MGSCVRTVQMKFSITSLLIVMTWLGVGLVAGRFVYLNVFSSMLPRETVEMSWIRLIGSIFVGFMSFPMMLSVMGIITGTVAMVEERLNKGNKDA